MMNPLEGIAQLFSGVNASKSDTEQTGPTGPLQTELDLTTKDEDLVAQFEEWKKEWDDSEVKKEWDKKSEEDENYWKGKQFGMTTEDRPLQDNVIFEALETFLPLITRRNPEPDLSLQSTEQKTPENMALVESFEKRLTDIADIIKLRLKLKKATRHWAIYRLGAVKLGWDLVRDMPSLKVIRPKKLILDPKATTDEDGYTGAYIGEHRELPASSLIALGVKHQDYIKDLVKGKLGTSVRFIEWWTNEYTCWILGDKVLLKKKNPNWNYEQTKITPQVDDMGNELPPIEETLPGTNHLPAPKMPYLLLSVLNLGNQPMDDTSHIEQNLAQQDKVNKRNRQIDQNADNMNNGLVVSLGRAGLTEDQAAKVAAALRKGGVVTIPDGSPRDAVDKFASASLPADVYNDLVDTRNRIRDVFGTTGSTPAGVGNEKTVRGKIIVRGLDTDRIGGGITEHIEQFADDIYNYLLQLVYVYEHPGETLPKVTVSITEGSMLPKDNVSIANQAIELATAQLLDPLTLFEKLEFPNPKETAKRLWLWANAPQMLFQDDPEMQQFFAMQAMAQQSAMPTANPAMPNPEMVDTGQDPMNEVPIPQ